MPARKKAKAAQKPKAPKASKKKTAKKKSPRGKKASAKSLFSSVAKGLPKLRKMTRLVAPKAAPADEGRVSGKLTDDPTSADILTRLRGALAPTSLLIKNMSEAHKGHKESKKQGGGHYALFVVSDLFHGLGRIQREQWIHSLLGDLFQSKKIHALKMILKDDDEASTLAASYSPEKDEEK